MEGILSTVTTLLTPLLILLLFYPSFFITESHALREDSRRGGGRRSVDLEVSHRGEKYIVVGNESGVVVVPCGVKLTSQLVLDHWWLRNGQRFTPPHSSNSIISSSSTPSSSYDLPVDLSVQIPLLSPPTPTTFRCVLKLPTGVLLGPTHTLQLAQLSGVVDEPSAPLPILGHVNESVLLPCPASSTPPPLITWAKLSSHSSAVESPLDRGVVVANNSLLIPFYREGDAGLYSCTLFNELLGKEIVVRVRLSTGNGSRDVEPSLSPLSVLDTFPPFLILSETEVEAHCAGKSNGGGGSVLVSSWRERRRSESEFGEESGGYRELGRVIKLSTGNGSGEYECVVRDGTHFATKTLKTFLPPSFPDPPSVRIPSPRTVRLECSTDLPLQWYKDGVALNPNSGRLKSNRPSELFISNTVESDSGVYQCETTIGSSESYIGTMVLSIESTGDLGAPQALRCSVLSPRGIRVEWESGRRGHEPITAFSLHYVPIGGGDKEKDVVTITTSKDLEQLQPGTTYSIYVRAYTSKFASPHSEKINCSTPSESPGKPTALRFLTLNDTAVRLSWDRPTGNLGTNPLMNYIIELNSSSALKNESWVVSTSETWVVLSGLHPNVNYNVRVVGEMGGVGEYSSSLVFRITSSFSPNKTTSSTPHPPLNGNTPPPPPQSPPPSSTLFSTQTQLGVIFGTLLSLTIIIICIIIIACRDRCFPLIMTRVQRFRRRSYHNGSNGKESGESAPLEMKVMSTSITLAGESIDSKSGLPNGGISSVLDPLMPRGRLHMIDDEVGSEEEEDLRSSSDSSSDDSRVIDDP